MNFNFCRIVLRLGSQSPFSANLKALEEEVRPLWKVPSCPRNFKRTSVERFFRKAEFALDWCSFRLVNESQQFFDYILNICRQIISIILSVCRKKLVVFTD